MASSQITSKAVFHTQLCVRSKSENSQYSELTPYTRNTQISINKIVGAFVSHMWGAIYVGSSPTDALCR